ncbi:porin family protein [Hanstruepera ponticola]|uniref:porin family protein n=1 Tax=Hanstruepera ponticola TaxID=2042995 RepID=UPI00177D9D09|nr:porin family protein [Hanstruepera ponticola]
MKSLITITKIRLLSLVFCALACNVLHSQEDVDTNGAVASDTTASKKQYKRVSDFKVYGGLTFSDIVESSDAYEFGFSTGFNAGIAFRKGRFAYWEIGAHYNGSIILLEETSPSSNQTLGSLGIQQIEMPVVVGLNLLSPVRRLFGLRVFAGLSPGYIFNVSDNDLNLTKDDLNAFQILGQAGIGVDIVFLFIDAGYKRGLNDLLKDQNSQLSQFFLNLGFRF